MCVCVCVCVDARIAPPFMEATDASRLVCVVVVSYQEYSLTLGVQSSTARAGGKERKKENRQPKGGMGRGAKKQALPFCAQISFF